MNIKKNNCPEDPLEFRHLNPGDVFQFCVNGPYLMKTEEPSDSYENYVNLVNGVPGQSDQDSDVIKVKHELVTF
jgi:hypothetical protein